MSLFSTYLATALIEQGNSKKPVTVLKQALRISRSRHIAPCIGFALLALGQLRLARALASTLHQQRDSEEFVQLLRRARQTLQRALTYDGLETDMILSGQLMLARIALLLDERATAEELITHAPR